MQTCTATTTWQGLGCRTKAQTAERLLLKTTRVIERSTTQPSCPVQFGPVSPVRPSHPSNRCRTPFFNWNRRLMVHRARSIELDTVSAVLRAQAPRAKPKWMENCHATLPMQNGHTALQKCSRFLWCSSWCGTHLPGSPCFQERAILTKVRVATHARRANRLRQ